MGTLVLRLSATDDRSVATRGERVLTRAPTTPFTSVRYAPRNTRRRVLRSLLVVLGLALLALIAVGVAGWVYGANRLEATPVAGLSEVPAEGPVNTLVLHSEQHDDTELLSAAVVQTGRAEPVILQFPLDLEVALPGSGGATIREAFATGGPEQLVAAIADYTGMELHHAHHISLAGLEQLAAHLDPETCPSDSCVAEHLVQIRRARELPLGLVDEHATVLRAVASEAGRAGLLLSPLRAKRVLDVAPDALATDLDLGPRGAMRQATRFAAAEVTALDVRTVPAYHDPTAGRTIPYPEQAETLFQALRDGSPVPADLGRTDPREDLLVPSQVRVLVLNGVGLEGLASTVAERLDREGYNVVGAENAEEFDDSLAVSRIQFRPESRHRADLVASVLPGAEFVESHALPRDVDVVVLVGNDQARP